MGQLGLMYLLNERSLWTEKPILTKYLLECNICKRKKKKKKKEKKSDTPVQ